MGVAYYIVLETEIEGLDLSMDGKILARQIDLLDAAALDLGVRPLTEFVGMDADALEGILGDDAGDIEVPPLEHFSAEDGLSTIRALLARPEAQPALDDLKECERILRAAAQHQVGWRFQIDI